MRIRMRTKDPLFDAYFRAIVGSRAEFVRGAASPDLVLLDLDTADAAESDAGLPIVTVSKREGATLVRPFREEDALAALGLVGGSISLSSDGILHTPRGLLRLSAREHAILALLAERAGETVSLAQLEMLWQTPPSKNLLRVTVSHLRERLAGHGITLRSVRGEGYRLLLET